MRLQHFTIILLSIGIVLFLVSFVIKPTTRATAQWSEEQAQQYSNATMRLHALEHQHGANKDHSHRHLYEGNQHHTDEKNLAEASAEFERLRKQLDQARTRGLNVAWLLRWSGIIAITVGIGGFVGRSFTAGH